MPPEKFTPEQNKLLAIINRTNGILGPEEQRLSDELDRFFEVANHEEIIDKVYEAYHSEINSAHQRAESLSEEEVSRQLRLIILYDEQVPSQRIPKEPNYVPDAGSYKDISTRAYSTFFKYGLEEGNFTTLIGLIKELKDPELAHRFIETHDTEQMSTEGWGDHEDLIEEINEEPRRFQEAFAEHCEREALLGGIVRQQTSTLLGALVFRVNKEKIIGRALEQIWVSTLSELHAISEMPSVQSQIAEKALHQRSINSKNL